MKSLWIFVIVVSQSALGCGASCGGGGTAPADAAVDGRADPDSSVVPDGSGGADVLQQRDAAYRDSQSPADAAVPDAQPTPDAAVTPDAGPNPFVLELPPTGQYDIAGFSNAGYIIAYSEQRDPVNLSEIYYYDILNRTEHQVTSRPALQNGPYPFNDQIMFHDYQFEDVGNPQVEIFHYDISSSTESRVTNSVSRKRVPVFNNDFMLYLTTEGCPTTTDYQLSLMNRHTSQVTVVSECDQDPETHSISDLYAAWSARPYPGHNKDIFVRDLQAGITFRIDTTEPGSQHFPHTDDNHVVWEDHRDGRREIYMYTFSTGQETNLTPDQWEQAWPHLRNGIVSWCDYRFTQEWGQYGRCDVYVYEIATGAGRRVTGNSGTWLPRFVDSGWIAYGLWITSLQCRLFAHDLVGDGILTIDGHVIP